MLRTVLRNKKGVTLVEVMIALVILLIVFMGLIQASILSIDQSISNVVRDEAVSVASDYMAKANSVSWLNLVTEVPVQEPRKIRNMSRNFWVTRTVTDRGTGHKEVKLTVEYAYKGPDFPYNNVKNSITAAGETQGDCNPTKDAVANKESACYNMVSLVVRTQ